MSIPQITPHEFIAETKVCERAQKKSEKLLEKIDTMSAELFMIEGFLRQSSEIRHVQVPIQDILTKYGVQDGNECKKFIENNLRLYSEKAQRRVQKNQKVLESAREAKERPLSEPDRRLKVSPEGRRAALMSAIEKVETLQQRLSTLTIPYFEVPMEEGERDREETGGKSRKRSLEQDVSLQEKQVVEEDSESEGGETGSGMGPESLIRRPALLREASPVVTSEITAEPPPPSELFSAAPAAPIATRIRMEQEGLSGLEEETKLILEENRRGPVRDERKEGVVHNVKDLHTRNMLALRHAQDLIQEAGVEVPNIREVQQRMVSLQALQVELGTLRPHPKEGQLSQSVTEKYPKRQKIADVFSIARDEEEQEKKRKIEEAVSLAKEVTQRVTEPSQERLLKKQHQQQKEVQDRYMAATGLVGTVGTFLIKDAGNVLTIAATQHGILEGLAAGAGALTQLNPLTQVVAAGVVVMVEVPTWSWTQRITGVVVGGVTTFFLGPAVGFSAGVAAGKYGPGMARRASEAASGIASPSLRKHAEKKLLECHAQRAQREKDPPPPPPPQ
jgi:hypothetical protein